MRRKPKVLTNCVANRYSDKDERIIEYSCGKLGGLISFTKTDQGLRVDLYQHDKQVDIVVAKPTVRVTA